MKLYKKSSDYILYQGNMLDMCEVIQENSVDSIVTDPPYGLTSITKRFGKENSAPAQFGKDGAFSRLSKGFMGKEWDGSGIEYNIDAWKKCYKILKPGGYLLAFGGTRTYHKIANAIEEAGFEIRDCIMWIYGSGFPKSMNISKGLEAREKLGKANTVAKRIIEQSCDGEIFKIKQTNNGAMGELIETTRKNYIPQTPLANKWKGWGTCLKPAYEPIIIARKPFKGSLIDNIIENNVGGLNIDECRVPAKKGEYDIRHYINEDCFQNLKPKQSQFQIKSQPEGRFPANIILTYDETDIDEVCNGFPNTKGGKMKLNSEVHRRGLTDDMPVFNSKNCGIDVNKATGLCNYGDSGSASRYFYCAKASRKDRDEGLNEINCKYDNKILKRNTHPTVKPTELMQYLIRLVTPKGGTICDPFMGSGSTGKATMYENNERQSDYKFIGIEITEEYLPIANLRIEFAKNNVFYDLEKEINPNEKNN